MSCYIPTIAESLALHNEAKNFSYFVAKANLKAHDNAFCTQSKCDCDFEFPDDCGFDKVAKKYSINCNPCCNPHTVCACCPNSTSPKISLYKCLIGRICKNGKQQPDCNDFDCTLKKDKLCCGNC